MNANPYREAVHGPDAVFDAVLIDGSEFTGEAESAPPTQGLSDIIGLVAAFIILMVLFRALVPTVIPLLFAIVAVLGAFLLLPIQLLLAVVLLVPLAWEMGVLRSGRPRRHQRGGTSRDLRDRPALRGRTRWF